MRAFYQWKAIEGVLGATWEDVDLTFTVEDTGSVDRAAGALGPRGPGRSGNDLRIHVQNRAGGRERLVNLLRRVDQNRLWGELELVGATVPAPPPEAPELVPDAGEPEIGLVSAWDALLSELPQGWSDVLAELELGSTDVLPRAALLGAPLNPARAPGAIALRFR